MIEDNFDAYSTSFKGSRWRVPTSLSVTTTPINRILIIGSCFSSLLSQVITEPHDHILFNGGVLDGIADIKQYDFQIIQIPLRKILLDNELWHLNYNDISAYEAAFSACRQRLGMYFHQYMRFHRESGLLSFVVNFIVPAQNSIGRLQPNYDIRNIQHFVRKLNEELEGLCLQHAQCHIIDIDSIAASHGKRYFTDETLLWFSHGGLMPLDIDGQTGNRIEPTRHIVEHYEIHDPRIFFNAVAFEVIAMYRTAKQADQIKLIVVDLDDTIWKGVSGEMERVESVISPIWTDPLVPMSEGWPLGVAEALLYCKKRGIMLAIISKNDEARIRGIFSAAFDGKISLDDFATFRINWRAKSENMREILSAINILPESVLFIDDNPVERTAMNRVFPEMRIIGRHFQYTRGVLLWSAETQVPVVTAESARRTDMVKAQIKRESDRVTMADGDFLAGLGVSLTMCRIDGLGHPKFARALELINKTNQWNSTGRRLDAAGLLLLLNEGHSLFGFSAKDKFTNYGDVGFIIIKDGVVSQFVMSCRVIGLQIETFAIREIMRELDLRSIEFEFIATGKNGVIGKWFNDKCVHAGDGYLVYYDKLPECEHIALVA